MKALVCIVAVSLFAAAAENPVVVIVGEISDSQCAFNVDSNVSSHEDVIKAGLGGRNSKQCTRACVRMGGKYVLVDSIHKKVSTLPIPKRQLSMPRCESECTVSSTRRARSQSLRLKPLTVTKTANERPLKLFLAHRHHLAVVLMAGLLHSIASGQSSDAARMLDSMHELPVGLGALPPLTIPTDNPASFLKTELGRRLFFDAQLSGNQSMSCATCHDPAKGFSDNRVRPMGSHGTQLPRHTPSLLNAGYNSYQFWDGRVSSLEQQAIEPLTSNTEMSMTDEGVLISRLEKDKYYSAMFREVFRDGPSLSNVAKALAAFERTIVGHGSRFDRYADGDKAALTAAEKNGLVLFIGKAHCARCHDGPNFTDNNFHNIGIDTGDDGRFLVTRLKEDRGAFKTPSLRNVTAHAPYMHDGSIPTLDAVIDYYDRGGNPSKGKSSFIFKTGLSNGEKRDLLEFLQTLNEPAGHPEQP